MVDGDIRVNGKPIDRSFCDMSGYVYQDDIFVGSLTAREHLLFTVHHSFMRSLRKPCALSALLFNREKARLKMNLLWSRREQDDRVNQLLCELGLTKCQNVPIGEPGVTKGLSGGERKRLSFAAQVLTDPPVLFCDEPTTGLDAYSAERLVVMLKGNPFVFDSIKEPLILVSCYLCRFDNARKDCRLYHSSTVFRGLCSL